MATHLMKLSAWCFTSYARGWIGIYSLWKVVKLVIVNVSAEGVTQVNKILHEIGNKVLQITQMHQQFTVVW